MSGERALEAFYAALLADDAEDLYERAPCGYLSTTPDGLITKVNQTFLTLTGFEREQLVGQRTFASLLTAGGRIYHETHYAPLLRMEGAARAIALEVVRADGQRLPVLVNAMLDRDADGAPAVIRAAVFDATDRRRYEQELLAAKQRAEASESRAMALASTLQQTLIPPAPPVVPGLDVAAAYRPAGRGDEVGGDFYDVFEVADGDWVVVVGDVCGKGAAAAIVTAAARYALRAAAIHEPKPSAVLALLDEVLAADGSDRYCTVALTRLHRTGTGWVATTCSGGHPLPVLLAAGRPPRVVGQPGALVGVFTNVTRVDVEVPLAPGDVLAFVTDGVTEGRRGRDFYGDDRLLAALADQPTAQAAVDHLLAEVLAFQDDLPRDDIVVVALGPPA